MKKPLDNDLLEQMKDRLSVAQGKHYWRSLEELAGDPHFEEMLHREFPRQAWAWGEGMSRRRFLSLMGASLALAGLSGCMTRPRNTIMPYAQQPEGLTPGKPLFFASTWTMAGYGTGVLVESHEYRPTKIEGNPQHPASRGATDAFMQAALLGLYDPDRPQSITYRGRNQTWAAVLEALRQRLAGAPQNGGARVAVLTEAIGSPTLGWQFDLFRKDYPHVQFFQYEPVNRDNVFEGAQLAFGRVVETTYDVSKADVIVTLDADFLGNGPGGLVYARQFSDRRQTDGSLEKARQLNRLYAIETAFSGTGGVADHRLALKPSQVEVFARSLASAVGVAGLAGPEAPEGRFQGEAKKFFEALVKDLTTASRRGRTLLVAGERQPPAVHAVVHALNAHLENVGQTVLYRDPILSSWMPSRSLAELVQAIQAGQVDTLLILGGNPVYTAPTNLELGKVLEEKLQDRQWLALHLSDYFDETSRLCHWHVPQAHFLEAWSDARAFDGTASIVQPLIAPLYAGRTAHELIAALCKRQNGSSSTYDERSSYELVRDYWRTNRPASSGDFNRYWDRALHDGVLEGTSRLPLPTPTLQPGWRERVGPMPENPSSGNAGLELVFAPDPTVYDGRFANNGWLQELPKTITRLTWDNALLLGPATAEKLKVRNGISGQSGGEHGRAVADVVTLTLDGRTLNNVPVWIVPGHAEDSATLHLGYGRTHAGRVGTGTGSNAYQLRTTTTQNIAFGLRVAPVGRQVALACVQGHNTMAGRDIVRSGTVSYFQKNPHFVTEHDHHTPPRSGGANDPANQARTHPSPDKSDKDSKDTKDGAKSTKFQLSLINPDEHPYNGYKWGMAVDLSSCIDCGACVVACQAENNIPVVGKEQVLRGREMHWLRIDRYFENPRQIGQGGQGEAPKLAADELRVHFMPVMCQHCETAPCELVCPVEATVHSDEGLNDMVYNRCVGTRYCANNCPYKVRRFNFLQYTDYDTASLKLMYNPEVTVRTRGVMEKCTFCIQRIAYARIEAAKEATDDADRPGETGETGDKRRVDPNRPRVAHLRDGEVVTACQAACPTNVFSFGDLNDPQSRVHQLQRSKLHYGLLSELGTRPRTGYLARLSNPNPELEK